MLSRGEQRLWTEKINATWRSPFAAPKESTTLAYQFTADNGVSLAVVPEKGIFRYDGGARQMGSAEVLDLENASHLVQLDTSSVPERLPAVAWGIEAFRLLQEHFPPHAVLSAIERYWQQVHGAETIEAVHEIFRFSREQVAQDPSFLIFPSTVS